MRSCRSIWLTRRRTPFGCGTIRRVSANEGATDDLAPTRQAFLMMPFDERFDWLWRVVIDAASAADISVVRADEIHEAGVVIDQIKAAIERADAVIGVCTDRNANVFYELGMALGQHEAILLAESETDLPFDLQHRRAILYEDQSVDLGWLRDQVRDALVATIAARPSSRVLAAPARADLMLVQRGGVAASQSTTSSTMNIPLELENVGTGPAALWWVKLQVPDGSTSSMWRLGERITRDEEGRCVAEWVARDAQDVVALGPPKKLEPRLHVEVAQEDAESLPLRYIIGAQDTSVREGVLDVGFRGGGPVATVES